MTTRISDSTIHLGGKSKGADREGAFGNIEDSELLP